MANYAFVDCLAANLFMTGLIWFVQMVHYPLFAKVTPDADAWRAYHTAHCDRTGYVVFAPMVFDLLSSTWLALGSRPPGLSLTASWEGFLAALVAWGVTGLVSVPAHNRLALGFDAATHRRLVRSNIARTGAWTYHSWILLWATWQTLNGRVAL